MYNSLPYWTCSIFIVITDLPRTTLPSVYQISSKSQYSTFTTLKLQTAHNTFERTSISRTYLNILSVAFAKIVHFVEKIDQKGLFGRHKFVRHFFIAFTHMKRTLILPIFGGWKVPWRKNLDQSIKIFSDAAEFLKSCSIKKKFTPKYALFCKILSVWYRN